MKRILMTGALSLAIFGFGSGANLAAAAVHAPEQAYIGTKDVKEYCESIGAKVNTPHDAYGYRCVKDGREQGVPMQKICRSVNGGDGNVKAFLIPNRFTKPDSAWICLMVHEDEAVLELSEDELTKYCDEVIKAGRAKPGLTVESWTCAGDETGNKIDIIDACRNRVSEERTDVDLSGSEMAYPKYKHRKPDSVMCWY
ncbi:hypothetical protein ACH437_23540 [Streptomyces xinghaiensis]|uniref:hypothetical protein n=1 Tax=Streptomyces xinghaiensis TaxID=1038928 RepID=UPI00378776D4